MQNKRGYEEHRKLYIKQVEGQILRIRQLLEGLERDIEEASLQELLQIIHKMKGTAPMLNFDEIGRLAKIIEGYWEWYDPSSDILDERDTLAREAIFASNESFQQLFAETGRLQINVEGITESHSIILQHESQKGHLLIVDDDSDLRAVVERKFTSVGFRVDEAENVSIAKKMLYEASYDLIILDLNMVPESGYVLFDFLKNDLTFKWIPLIVLSGEDDVEEKVKCLDLGADDYVTKPFKFKELKARVCRLLTRAKEFEQMAFRDALTDVYNRRYFENHITVQLQKIKWTDEQMTLALLDIDKFKSINDTYGHPVGDMVLQGFAHLIKENLREFDFIARFGGEEFIILFNKTSEKTALKIVEQMLNNIRSHPLTKVDEAEIFITFSAGIAAWQKGLTKQEWIERSDQLLYQAKQAGRNRCMTWSNPNIDITLKSGSRERPKRVLIPSKIKKQFKM